MADVDAVLESAGLKNEKVREYVRHWAEITSPANIEVVSVADDDRLIEEALDANEIEPAGEGLYYSRSYYKDTARSEERTIVATNNESDKGVYNNWHPAGEMKAKLTGLMRGASAGKTMYVIPYLMAAPGSPLEKYAAGVQLTDNRSVVLHMNRMARVHVDYINNLEDQDSFVRAVHVTGDLENLGQGTPEDKRYFVTVADERTILHFGSSYGGNALLGKIAHGLRQAAYDGWASRGFLAEQFMLLGITDKRTGKRYHIAGGFPSASGKTNLAMTLPPDALGDRYHVEFYGDDIAWLWVGEDGRLYGMNPEFGVFGVAKDTNEGTNPTAIESIAPGTKAIFTNVAYNEKTRAVWWEGRTKNPPADLDGWLDWKGNRITDPAEGVYDGLTLGAEATFAAEGVHGQLRYDPMSMRPFMSYPEGAYAAHWLAILGQCAEPPIFAHVNWFQRDAADGHFLWPGYRENLRALLWLMQLHDGSVTGVPTPVGILPAKEELNLDGLSIGAGDLDKLITIDTARWRQEMGFREAHLAQFDGLPEEIWAAHRRVAAALGD